MAGKKQYTAEQMIDALQATKGMITLASKRLGCSYNTMRRYIKLYPTVAEAQQNAKDDIDDQVELTLINMAMGERGSDGRYIREPNIASLIFYAKTQMRGRGYTEKLDIGFDLDQLKEFNEAMRTVGKDPSDVLRRITDKARSEQHLQ